MRVVLLHDGLEGAVLAMPVHGDGGRLMLNRGTRLTRRLIAALKQRGYTRVAIDDPVSADVELDDAVREETRLQAENALEEATKKLLEGKSPDMGPVKQAVDGILADLRQNPKKCIAVYSLRMYDQSTYTHCVNVCVLTLGIGDTMGWSFTELRTLGMAALLHDIGKMLVPTTILNKPDKLTQEEYELVKTHAEKGWSLLKDCYGAGPLVAQGALEHHERLDGSGYPRNLKKDEISTTGKITAVADVYEAMISDRPQRRGIFPESVYAFLTQNKDSLFESQAVESLFKRVALYPTGTIISLWGGYVALVTKQDPRSNLRPFVRIVVGPGITKPIDVSLYERPDIKVNFVLDDLPEGTKRIMVGNVDDTPATEE